MLFNVRGSKLMTIPLSSATGAQRAIDPKMKNEPNLENEHVG
jgi:hypothetical protein